VESRNERHPYCSRVCCSEAIKNALDIKRLLPEANVAILGRDMRTYGFREVFFQRAREAGVLFVRHPEKSDPKVTEERGALRVSVTDSSSNHELVLRPDLLVLSTGIAPAKDNPILSGLLRSALTADGFFLEAHPKLRPVDLANEGEFLCGLAPSPRFMDETIAQAQATVGRATTVLAKTHLEIPRPGGKGHPRELRCLRDVRQGLPLRGPDDQRDRQSRDPGRDLHGLRELRRLLPGKDDHATAPRRPGTRGYAG
jgi:heterodisulfide reductase subunit A2